MLRSIWVDSNGVLHQGALDLIPRWKTEGGQLWVDMYGEDAASERRLLHETFAIPHLSIDDAVRDRHPPKLEHLPEHLFLIWRGLHAQTDSMDFRTIQIALWLGDNILISRHNGDSPSIEKAWAYVLEKGVHEPEKWLYRVLRNVVDRYTPIIIALEERLEGIEDEMISKPSDSLLAELMAYSRQLKRMRRILRYHERFSLELCSDDCSQITLRQEFKDVHEHNERLVSLSDMYHEMVGDLINGYLSVASHKLNQIMRILTVVTVMLAPMSVLVGIYGMNFEFMPELKMRYGYFVLLGTMFAIVASLGWLFRRRGWL